MNLVTRNAYAKLCGVSRQAIHDRIKRGTLTTIESELPDGSTREYIDTEEHPPEKRKPGRNQNRETVKDKKWASKQMTKEQAIIFYDSNIWEKWTSEQIVRFQLFQKRLCIDFGDFQMAVQKVLGRSVWTHEFANRDNLVQEYLGTKSAPSIEEIFDLIPSDKLIILKFKKP